MSVLRSGVLLALMGAASAAVAQSDQTYRLNIPRQKMELALLSFARETGLQVVRFNDVDETSLTSNTVAGDYTARQALEILLSGSGLQHRFINDHTIAIVRIPPPTTVSGDGVREAQPAVTNSKSEGEQNQMDKPKLFTRLVAVLFGCAQVASWHGACAEEETGALQEVVVTAQRMQENLQKAPLAVTAVNADTFNKLGGGDISAVQMVAPNVQISTNGSGGGQIGIRGITTGNTTDVGDPAVAFEIDGIYQARAQTQGGTLFDVDRIEILRGPQGTLYGRNATTGVINVITKKPTNDFSADGYVEVGNYREFNGFAALNVPLSDTTAIRAAFISANHSPIFDNGLGGNRNYGDQHENAGRVHFSMKPLDSLSILLTGNYQEMTGNGTLFALAYPSVPLSSDPYNFTVSEQGILNMEQWGGNAVVAWTLPFGTLEYDGGLHQSSLYEKGGVNGAVPYASLEVNPADSRTQQHEVRLSNATDKFKYVAGLYYFREKQVWDIYINPFAAFVMPYEEEDSKAAYGQVTYSLTDVLRLTGGLRYTKDHKTRTGGNYGYDADGNLFLLYPNFADINSNKLNYRVGVDYDLAPSELLYASYATGYKGGGFFDGVPPGNTYAPENVSSAEVGLKSRFLNNRLQLNVAAFHYKYTDFQVSYQDRVTLVTKTYNAQEAKNYGLEIEAEAAPDENNRLGMSFTYLHARYAKFDFPGGAVDSYGFSSYSGKTLPYAPDWGVNLNFEHDWHLPGDRKITAGVLSHWQSRTSLEFHGFANTQQGSYSKTDLNLSWGDAKGRYSVTAFVRNVENKAVLTAAALVSTTDPTAPTAGTLAPPRTYGVRANFSIF